jgi:Polyketide cyclase / dehydrase and lipid transport
MPSLSAEVQVTANADQAAVFAHIVPIDLGSIFTGYGPLPAVTGTQDQVGAWDAVGQTRTVNLSDGSSAQELLTAYERPSYFSYTVSGFTGALRHFTSSAKGEWWFTTVGRGRTNIKWRYAFNPKSALAVPILWFIANVLWRNYMRKALQLSKLQVERSAT